MIDSDFFQQVLNFLRNGLLHFSGWQIFFYTLATTHLTIASVTIYLHRCQAHRAIDLHPAVAHFFRFWLWCTTGMVTKEWTAIHRKHHAKVETKDDPHSPQIVGLKKVLLEGAELYREEAKNKATLEKYGKGTPDDWLERHVYGAHSGLGLWLSIIVNVCLFGVIGLTVSAIQMVWIPFWAAGVVNGLAHFWGYRHFDCVDASRNISPIGLLIGGEEMHNNHHAYPTSAKFSNKWYEFDIGWLYIRLLSLCKLAKVKRLAPLPKFSEGKTLVDLETLQAVIVHRYDLMARYAKSLRRTCLQESKRLKAVRHPAKELVAAASRWLHLDSSSLSEHQNAKLSTIFAASTCLEQLVRMRKELTKVWEATHLNRDQLVLCLQQWCSRAETSDVPALRELSRYVRSYVV